MSRRWRAKMGRQGGWGACTTRALGVDVSAYAGTRLTMPGPEPALISGAAP